MVSDLNVCSQEGPGRAVRLHHRRSHRADALRRQVPADPDDGHGRQAAVDGETTTCSGMAWGFNPYLTEADPYRGAYMAVVESVTKLVCAGFHHEGMYLTFQEYFEHLSDSPSAGASRWPPCWCAGCPDGSGHCVHRRQGLACPAALRAWTCPRRWSALRRPSATPTTCRAPSSRSREHRRRHLRPN